jgi:phage terminase large subunit-like protein
MMIDYRLTAEQYVDDVLEGRQVAGQWIRLACERHRRDLAAVASGERPEWRFDEIRGAVAIQWFPVAIRHTIGEWGGQPVELEPWEQFIIWVVFGWQRLLEDGQWARRFRTVYIEVGRKNGKSLLVAGIGLFLLEADSEPGAQVFTAATKRSQARIIHQQAVEIVQTSPVLRSRLMLHANNIHNPRTFSKFEPLGRDSKTEDGLNVHGALLDELHAHPNGRMFSVLDTATGARRQPLIVMITTAGNDPISFCKEMHDYTLSVLKGAVVDDRHFGAIYSLDAGDKWQDEAVWVKANPNLGVSKRLDDMRSKLARAAAMPSSLAEFQQKELNMWLSDGGGWLDYGFWRECEAVVDEDALAGRPCLGGLDLSSTRDLTAWVLIFPPVGRLKRGRANGDGGWPLADRWVMVPRFFVPEVTVARQVAARQGARVDYGVWVKGGSLIATPGRVLDLDMVYEQIERDAGKYNILHVGYDPWNSTQIVNRLITLRGDKWAVQVRQGFASLSEPSKLLERMISAGELAHGNNPVMNWMVSHVKKRTDTNQNIMPDKGGVDANKVDGISATANALHVAMRVVDLGRPQSVYAGRGMRVLGA